MCLFGGATAAPAPTVTPADDELPLAERIKLSDARNAILKEARKQTSKERLQGLSKVYRSWRLDKRLTRFLSNGMLIFEAQ